MFPHLPPIPRRRGKGALGPVAEDINTLAGQVAELQRRVNSLYPQPTPTVSASVTPQGTTYTATPTPIKNNPGRLPFEIYHRSIRLEDGSYRREIVGAPGSVNNTTIDETIEENPADGNWYFYVRVTIDDATGAATEVIARWFNAIQTDTATVGHQLMNSFTITDGVPEQGFIIGGINYGPVYWFAKGGVDDKWEVVVL